MSVRRSITFDCPLALVLIIIIIVVFFHSQPSLANTSCGVHDEWSEVFGRVLHQDHPIPKSSSSSGLAIRSQGACGANLPIQQLGAINNKTKKKIIVSTFFSSTGHKLRFLDLLWLGHLLDLGEVKELSAVGLLPLPLQELHCREVEANHVFLPLNKFTNVRLD